MLLDQRAELGFIFGRNLARDDAVGVELAPVGEVGDAAGHPGARIPSHRPQRDGDAAGHVLAEVIPRALDHRHRSRVAHAEPLADATGNEELPAGGAVADRVAGEHGVR